MKINRVLFISILLIMQLTACVERYYPEEDAIFTGTLVVNAHLTDKAGIQEIEISRSGRLIYSTYIPESNCVVEVINDHEGSVSFYETEPGHYAGDIKQEFLSSDYQYQLRMLTADGNRYESDFTTLSPSPDIYEVYYELESQPTEDPEVNLDGLRFYVDFEMDRDSAEFLRWELIETYEFHNPNYEGFIFDVDRILKPLPPEMDDRECWITLTVNRIFTLWAGNISGTVYSRFPLHYVSNETQRLKYGYSLLVRQLSMDPVAFRYWDELKKNTQEMGAINDRQPAFTPGNICNCDDPEERILGYFSISGVTEKRIFVKDVEGLEVPDRIFCFPTFEPPNLRFLMRQDLPVFLSRATWPLDQVTYLGLTQQHCLDCRLHRGSSGEPPDFWPF